MTRKQALMDLRNKVAAGEFDCRTYPLDKVPQLPKFPCFIYAYHGSLDAAFALHKAVLPPINQYTIDEGPSGCGCHLVIWPDGLSGGRELQFKTTAETPSRSWLLAILSALIAECDE